MSAPAHIARANLKNARKPKGSKHKSTIEKEKMQEYYEEQLGKHFRKLTEKHIKAALKEVNRDERKYAFDRLMGKPAEKIEHVGEMTLKIDV